MTRFRTLDYSATKQRKVYWVSKQKITTIIHIVQAEETIASQTFWGLQHLLSYK